MAAETAEALERKRARNKAWRDANPEWTRAYRKAYREEHKDQIRIMQKAWREENKEALAARRKAQREVDPETARERDRLAHARRRGRELRLRKAREHAREWRILHPDEARERSRQFRAAHPDKVREYRRRYRERHPERVRADAMRYRDTHAEEVRDRQRRAAAVRREQDPDGYKRWYAENLEAQRARGREAARHRARLKRHGLPPRQLHKLYAEERRSNEQAASDYFARLRTDEERAFIAAEVVDGFALDLPTRVASIRRRIINGRLPAIEYVRRADDSGEYRERAVQIRHEERAARLRKLRQRELDAEKNRHEQELAAVRARRPHLYEHHRSRREADLREEIRMDSVARVVRGLAPYDSDAELEERLNEEIEPAMRAELEAVKRRTLTRVRRVMNKYGDLSDPAAPHQAPGIMRGHENGLVR